MGNKKNSSEVKRYAKPLVYMLTGGFEFLVEEAGGECKGFSIKANYGDALLVIRADFEGTAMVAFVGSATGAGAIVRAHHEFRNGGLKWREDLFALKG